MQREVPSVRKGWTAPKLQRLMVSGAELGSLKKGGDAGTKLTS
jgi:hypothetical protein